jgi:hypothetical protein
MITGTYAWKYSVKADVQKVGSELETLYEEHGKLTPVLIVDDARNPDRETHQLIEWDETEAATKYRLEQARYIMRNIIVVRTEPATATEDEKIIRFRAFENVDVEEGRYFMPMQTALQRDDTRSYMLQQAMRALSSFRRKYGMIQELSTVIDAIDRTEKEFTGLQLAA